MNVATMASIITASPPQATKDKLRIHGRVAVVLEKPDKYYSSRSVLTGDQLRQIKKAMVHGKKSRLALSSHNSDRSIINGGESMEGYSPLTFWIMV